MPSSTVSSATRLISKLLVDEAKYLYLVKDKVEGLHDELVWIRTFLQDADAREQEDEIVRLWVSQIRDFAYEAEDIVEKYLHGVSNHRQDGFCNTIKWFSCICRDALPLHKVGSEIDRLKQRISGLCSRMQIYGVKTNSGGNSSRRRRVMELRRTQPEVRRDEIVGLREDTDKLVGLLKNPDPKFICISGMGGLGKTTLAQMIYADLKVEFQNQAWIYVSQQFQARNIWEAILVKLEYIDIQDIRNIKDLRDEELPSKVCQVLLEKKCLVVLDDIWNEGNWRELAPAFATLKRSQSKLVLTTRNEKLLSHVGAQGHHHIANKLTKEESWDLLQKIVLRENGTSAIDSDMEEVGKKMAEDCDGLPLAVVVLGGILGNKSTLEEWRKVEENFASSLKKATNKQDNQKIIDILELSYYDLPYYLKPCFLHLGSFPEDFEIPTRQLYHMWEMEGIVSQPIATGEASVESIAQDYLQELVDRCLVQLGKTGKTGKIKSCRLHDLIRDMCLKKANEENFLNVFEHGDFKRESISSSFPLPDQRLRRVAIYMHKSCTSVDNLITDHHTHHVRSLLFFPTGKIQRKLEWTQGTMSKALELVRVLAFEDICIRSLPSEIGDLFHLRYLSLKGTLVSKIPSSICKLRYLQILDLQIRKCIDVVIPEELRKLKRLKHLYLPNNWKVKVRIIDRFVSEINSPIKAKLRLKGFRQLETVENLRLEECEVNDLVKLVTLQKVSLADYVVTEMESFKSFLKFLSIAAVQLRKPVFLSVDGNLINKEPSILASNTAQQINRIEISGKILVTLSYARMFPQDLKQLTLSKCEFEDDPMPILEKLSKLSELTLGERSFLGTKMVCTAGNFPQLAILRLIQLINLEELNVEQGAMPCLKSLYIYSCEKLGNIPAELPRQVKIGCRPCIQGFQRYGNCYYERQQAADA